jgi:hypothetical protein
VIERMGESDDIGRFCWFVLKHMNIHFGSMFFFNHWKIYILLDSFNKV